MQLSELFSPQLMQLDVDGSQYDKNGALELIADLLGEAGKLDDKAGYVQALQAREEQSTTGVGDEIAIPHAQHESIEEPMIVFLRANEGIEWDSFDQKPAKLIFGIAAPKGGGSAHLDALAKLSSVLMNEEAKAALMQASTPEEVIAIFQQREQPEETTSDAVNVSEDADEAAEEKPFIVAVTACPTGIAHTFMAEEKLKQAAAKAGYEIKVETNGQNGVNNKLTKVDIERATAVIVAADKQVAMARFDGKPLLNRKVADGINKADELVQKAAQADASTYHAKAGEQTSADESSEGESLGRRFYKHLMNGVSHMLPFVVAGGILIALSFSWGLYAADVTHEQYNEIAHVLNNIGGMAFAMMLPMLAGFIGQSIADRPGLVVGFMGGIFANPGILGAFSQEGVMENIEPSGFLGALVAGFLAGGIILALRKAFAWMPKSLEGMKPIFIFPVLGVLFIGVLMLFVVNAPMAWVMNGIMNFLSNIPREYSIILGFVVAAMMSIDMGGPINKAAYVTGTALITASNGAGSDVMAAVMIGGMVPPLAIAFSATVNKHLWTEQERNGAYVNYVMGAAFITEGAIPYAASNPLRVIPPLAIGSGVAGALSMFFGSVSQVPHGGIFAILAGGVSNPVMYLLAWLIGGAIGALGLYFTLRNHDAVK